MSKKVKKGPLKIPFRSLFVTALFLSSLLAVTQLLFIFGVAPSFPGTYVVDNSFLYLPVDGLLIRETGLLVVIAWITIGIALLAFLATVVGKKRQDMYLAVTGLALLLVFVPLVVANQFGDAINNLYGLEESLTTLFVWLLLFIGSAMLFLRLEKRELNR